MKGATLTVRPAPRLLALAAALTVTALACATTPTAPALLRPAEASDPIEIWLDPEAPFEAPACPPGRCVVRATTELGCPAEPASAIVLAGHAMPPTYLGLPAERVAALIACRRPELVVLDTCYGASTPILRALARQPAGAPTPLVVGASFWVRRLGLAYDAPFFDPSRPVAERAGAVRSLSGRELLRWRPDEAPLAALEEAVARLTADEVRAERFRRDPPLIRRKLAAAGDAEVVIPASP